MPPLVDMKHRSDSENEDESNDELEIISVDESSESDIVSDISNDEDEDAEDDVEDEELQSSAEEDDVNEGNDSEEDQSSDDEGPESVSFETGKKDVLQAAEVAIKQIAKEKLEIKQKRKAQDDLYKKQKREKLDRLKGSRLPDEILNTLATNGTADRLDEDNSNASDTDGDDADDDEYEEDEQSDSEIKAITMNDVMKINEETIISLGQLKEGRLNGKYNQRQSNKKRMAQNEKRKLN